MATRTLILSFFLFLLSTQAFAQERPVGSIVGKVTDASNGQELPGVNVVVLDLVVGAATDLQGRFEIHAIPEGEYSVQATFVGFSRQTIANVKVVASDSVVVNFALQFSVNGHEEIVVEGDYSKPIRRNLANYSTRSGRKRGNRRPKFNTEDYDSIVDSAFRTVKAKPLSTFSIDVDAASYSNIRRFIRSEKTPPSDAVRIEEMINYFTYDYPGPEGDDPFSITTEIGDAPWNPENKLVHIGLQGKKIAVEDRPASNLVFLLDVSGSMNSFNKLPLVKRAMHMLVDQLTEKDRVAIVVYAGAAGLVLPSTPGAFKGDILESLLRLQAGGSTAGAQGIRLAYEVARQNFIPDGNNRVILATDGDFNVGVSSDGELVKLIEQKRRQGTFLTVLGFGTGNIKDNKMEKLADKGNGNYYYIDSPLEARKVLVSELGSTLFTIAKDVKIQVEFNPTYVHGYRLIGYENRMLASEDFDDDTKDAGELGAGHSVTALYEVVPVGAKTSANIPEEGDLRYQNERDHSALADSDEWMNVKLRYKKPAKRKSQLVEQAILAPGDSDLLSNDFKFSASVAAFGMILRNSEYKGKANLEMVLSLANEGLGHDWENYRKEYIQMVEGYRRLSRQSE